jgi:thiamine biosynthesis protein ThiS
MVIKVNGQDRTVAEGTNILVLLDGFKLTPDKVAVELNRRLVRTTQYAAALKDGDEVEIVTFVGGG